MQKYLFTLLFFSNLAWTDSCPQGQTLDPVTNRCVLSKDTVENKTQAINCDQASDEGYKECFHKNVSDEIAEAKDEGKIQDSKTPDFKLLLPSVISLGSAYLIFEKQSLLSNCSSTSIYLMTGAGVSSLLGELLAQNSYKKTVKGLKDKYTERMSSKADKDAGESVLDSVTENQKLAFDFQIEQEKAREKAHKARQNTYYLATGLYAAASIAALYETFSDGGASSSCAVSLKKDDQKLFYASLFLPEIFEKYSYLKNINPSEFKEIITREIFSFFIPSAHALTESETLLGMTGIAAYIKYAEGSFKAILNPGPRAALTGLLSGYSLQVAQEAKNHAKKSNQRVNVLQDLKASFVSNGGAGFSNCSSEDRDNKNKPGCFCFTENGNRDPDKTGVSTCVELFAASDTLKASSYGSLNSSEQTGLSGCFDKNKKFDPTCKCKEQKDSKSKTKDDCFYFSGKANLGSLAKLPGVKSLAKDSVNFNRGNITTANLSGVEDHANNLLRSMNKTKEKLLQNKKYKPQLDKIAKLQKKLNDHFANKINSDLASGNLKDPFGGELASSSSNNAKDILKDFKGQIKAHKANFQKGKAKPGQASKPNLADYNFNDSTSGKLDIEDVDAVMKKEYSFNDINENSGNNIFKIITNRYQRSGLRRLFDENGISQADEANNTEVHEK